MPPASNRILHTCQRDASLPSVFGLGWVFFFRQILTDALFYAAGSLCVTFTSPQPLRYSPKGPKVKISRKCILAGAFALATSAPALAAGSAILNETATSNTFTNGQSGQIVANARATGGVATAVAGQRVVAPLLTYRATVTTTNSRYVNNGRIEANARATAGVATAVAGQHVTM